MAQLAAIAATLEGDFAEDAAWAGSPFAWIKTRPSRQVGKIGEGLVAGWAAAKGFDVARSPDSDADRLINGHRAEIKLSTLWKGGSYRFQQIRDQNYRFVILLGLSPFDAHCWVIPKAELMDRWGRSVDTRSDAEGIRSQHGGAEGRDTAWLAVDPTAPPSWLARFGGSLSEAARVLERLAPR